MFDGYIHPPSPWTWTKWSVPTPSVEIPKYDGAVVFPKLYPITLSACKTS